MRYIFPVLLCLVGSSCSTGRWHCTSGWIITGYYTPLEHEFSSKIQQNIHVREFGHMRFAKDFLKRVRNEGWGRTRFGWYLGFYNGKWHKSSAPRDAAGQPLRPGTIAVDPSVIRHGHTVHIPSVYADLRRRYFIARDVGQAVQNRHIDIYTGEGNKARQLAYKITGQHHQVCM